MAVDGFARSLPFVLAYEGGKVDNPKDPGGRTNQGVIQRVYDAWRTSHGEPLQDVYKMSDGERDAIFRKQYWDAVQGDKMPPGVDFALFDGAVNSGPKQSIKWMQRALGLNADGVIGAMTLGALVNVDTESLIDDMIDRRETFLKALKTFKTFGKGWFDRTRRLRQSAKSMVTHNSVVVVPAPVAEASPKADVSDAIETHGKAVADGATGAGASGLTLSAVIQGLQDQLTPFSAAGPWIAKVVVILAIASAVLTIGGLLYRFWASRRRAKVADALDLQVVK